MRFQGGRPGLYAVSCTRDGYLGHLAQLGTIQSGGSNVVAMDPCALQVSGSPRASLRRSQAPNPNSRRWAISTEAGDPANRSSHARDQHVVTSVRDGVEAPLIHTHGVHRAASFLLSIFTASHFERCHQSRKTHAIGYKFTTRECPKTIQLVADSHC